MEPVTEGSLRHLMKAELISLPFYRDLLAEFLATFFLATSANVLGLPWPDQPTVGPVLLVGLGMMWTMCSLIWSLCEFGGIHMNPSVTMAFFLIREITPSRAALYVLVQCCAPMAATMFIRIVLPESVTIYLKPTTLHPDLASWQGYLIETWLTFYLVLTVLGSTDETRKKEGLYVPPLIISMALATCIGSGLLLTGSSMNPALTFGVAVVLDVWDNHWVYWAGPLSGSLLATLLYKVLLDMADNPSARAKLKRCLHSSYSSWFVSHDSRREAKADCDCKSMSFIKDNTKISPSSEAREATRRRQV